jgi:hypothetical protein
MRQVATTPPKRGLNYCWVEAVGAVVGVGDVAGGCIGAGDDIVGDGFCWSATVRVGVLSNLGSRRNTASKRPSAIANGIQPTPLRTSLMWTGIGSRTPFGSFTSGM